MAVNMDGKQMMCYAVGGGPEQSCDYLSFARAQDACQNQGGVREINSSCYECINPAPAPAPAWPQTLPSVDEKCKSYKQQASCIDPNTGAVDIYCQRCKELNVDCGSLYDGPYVACAGPNDRSGILKCQGDEKPGTCVYVGDSDSVAQHTAVAHGEEAMSLHADGDVTITITIDVSK